MNENTLTFLVKWARIGIDEYDDYEARAKLEEIIEWYKK